MQTEPNYKPHNTMSIAPIRCVSTPTHMYLLHGWFLHTSTNTVSMHGKGAFYVLDARTLVHPSHCKICKLLRIAIYLIKSIKVCGSVRICVVSHPYRGYFCAPQVLQAPQAKNNKTYNKKVPKAGCTLHAAGLKLKPMTSLG